MSSAAAFPSVAVHKTESNKGSVERLREGLLLLIFIIVELPIRLALEGAWRKFLGLIRVA
jgi:hypothetical protein